MWVLLNNAENDFKINLERLKSKPCRIFRFYGSFTFLLSENVRLTVLNKALAVSPFFLTERTFRAAETKLFRCNNKLRGANPRFYAAIDPRAGVAVNRAFKIT